MLVANDLATLLKGSLGFAAEPNSSQIVGVAQSIVDELGMAAVTFLPNTINGTAPPSGGPPPDGGPLIGGTGAGGTIAGPTGATLAAKMVANCGFPSTPQLTGWCGAIATHLITGIVTLPTVTGTCTNTPTSLGVLIGEATGGLISGLVGPALAATMASGLGQPGPSPQLLQFANDFVSYIMSNAEVTFVTGTITAIAPAGGGPITAGAGSGGTIS